MVTVLQWRGVAGLGATLTPNGPHHIIEHKVDAGREGFPDDPAHFQSFFQPSVSSSERRATWGNLTALGLPWCSSSVRAKYYGLRGERSTPERPLLEPCTRTRKCSCSHAWNLRKSAPPTQFQPCFQEHDADLTWSKRPSPLRRGSSREETPHGGALRPARMMPGILPRYVWAHKRAAHLLLPHPLYALECSLRDFALLLALPRNGKHEVAAAFQCLAAAALSS
jgi:hypothetical protein